MAPVLLVLLLGTCSAMRLSSYTEKKALHKDPIPLVSSERPGLFNLKRVSDYTFQPKQFPKGSEFLTMPRTVLFSIFWGPINSYKYAEYTVASMAKNKEVDYVVINIDNEEKEGIFAKAAEKYNLPNLFIKYQTTDEFRERVKDRLDIDVPFTSDWYYKLCDYKPTLAYLFPEVMDSQDYKYWGFADLDVVWGNTSRFAHLMQGQYPIIQSGWFTTGGALLIMENKEWSQKLFMDSPLYVPSLRNQTYHNLDEGGVQVAQEQQLGEHGEHSMVSLIDGKLKEMKWDVNHGKHEHDKLFCDYGDVKEWLGPVVWQDGSLKSRDANEFFAAGREHMIFHVRQPLEGLKESGWEIPEEAEIEKGLANGFYVPSWEPIQ